MAVNLTKNTKSLRKGAALFVVSGTRYCKAEKDMYDAADCSAESWVLTRALASSSSSLLAWELGSMPPLFSSIRYLPIKCSNTLRKPSIVNCNPTSKAPESLQEAIHARVECMPRSELQ